MFVVGHDPDEAWLARQLTPDVVAAQEVLVAAKRHSATRGSATLDPVEAADEIGAAIQASTASIRSQAAYHSPLKWLWVLRRLPRHLFSGDLATTWGYGQTLAEVLTSDSPGETKIGRRGDRFQFDLGGAFVRRLLRFCIDVRYLFSLQVAYRWAGKGARIARSAEGVYWHVRSDLDDHVHRFDQRVAASHVFGDRAGTEALVPLPAHELTAGTVLVPCAVDPVTVPVGHRIPGHPASLHIRAHYLGWPYDTRPLVELISSGSVSHLYPREVGDLLTLCYAFPALCVLYHGGLLAFLQRGYVIADRAGVERVLQLALDEGGPISAFVGQVWGATTATEVVDRCRQMAGSCWPLVAGPPIRGDGDSLCVDFLCVRQRLEALLEFPRVQGASANVRADHFEEQVQRAIDRTPWAPPDSVRMIRGRPLRLRGREITDVDSIACNGTTVLLISCKTLVFSREYDRGDHKTVRNAASTVESAIDEWEEKTATLRANPLGDNYDLRHFQSVIGLVCTPFPVFTRRSPVVQLPRLPGDLAVSELTGWLMENRG